MAYTKQRIVFLNNKKKYKLPTITKLLFEREDIIVTRQGVARVLKRYKETGTIDRHRGVTVLLQWTASYQQISTSLLKTGAMWINASTWWDACVFSTRSQRSASGIITPFDRVFLNGLTSLPRLSATVWKGFLARTVYIK